MLATGFASPADNFVEERLNINDLLIDNDTATYFFRIQSEYKQATNIRRGDILVVDRSKPLRQSCYAVAILNQSFTLIYVENKAESFIYDLSTGEQLTDKIEVWGVVQYCIHQLHSL